MSTSFSYHKPAFAYANVPSYSYHKVTASALKYTNGPYWGEPDEEEDDDEDDDEEGEEDDVKPPTMLHRVASVSTP